MKNLFALLRRAYANTFLPPSRSVAERQLARARLDYLDVVHTEEEHRAYADACAIQAAVIARRIKRLADYSRQPQ